MVITDALKNKNLICQTHKNNKLKQYVLKLKYNFKDLAFSFLNVKTLLFEDYLIATMIPPLFYSDKFS